MPAEWEPAPDRGLGPSVTHGWAAQPECERSAAMVRRTRGQYVAVCPRLQLTSHTQPTSTFLRIKYERYIFIKKCVRSFIEVVIIDDYVSIYVLCICICIMSIQQFYYVQCIIYFNIIIQHFRKIQWLYTYCNETLKICKQTFSFENFYLWYVKFDLQ